MSILPATLESLRKAEERVQRVAERLARLPLDGEAAEPQDVVDLSADVVALIAARNAHSVNAKAAGSAQELDRRVLDILG